MHERTQETENMHVEGVQQKYDDVSDGIDLFVKELQQQSMMITMNSSLIR